MLFIWTVAELIYLKKKQRFSQLMPVFGIATMPILPENLFGIVTVFLYKHRADFCSIALIYLGLSLYSTTKGNKNCVRVDMLAEADLERSCLFFRQILYYCNCLYHVLDLHLAQLLKWKGKHTILMLEN